MTDEIVITAGAVEEPPPVVVIETPTESATESKIEEVAEKIDELIEAKKSDFEAEVLGRLDALTIIQAEINNKVLAVENGVLALLAEEIKEEVEETIEEEASPEIPEIVIEEIPEEKIEIDEVFPENRSMKPKRYFV